MKKMPLLLVVFALSAIASFAQPQPSGSNGSPPKAAGGTAKSAIVLPPEKTQPVRLPLFDKPPVIDGKLDDEIWKHAIVLKDFYQVQPGDNIAPSKPTEVMLGYDAKTLYFGFHCYDDPTKVKATVTKRDQVFGDDNVRVFLDTFDDQRRAYILGWNPLG